MSLNPNLAGRLKTKHASHKFLDRRRFANNHTQSVQTEFPYKRLSYLYNEIGTQHLIRTRKWIWQICSCIRKMRCCGGTFIKEAKLVDSQKLFQFFFVEAMKTLAKLKLLRKERALAMGKDSKYSVNSILVEMKNKLKDIFSILL